MTKEIENFKEIVCILLKSLRNGISQSQMSKKLGYSYNIYGRWESGKRAFLWNDFIAITTLKKQDLENSFLLSFKIPLSECHKDSSLLKVYLKTHSGQANKYLSKKKIDRVIRGERKLKFLEFLLLFDDFAFSSLRFLQYFIDDESFQKMKKANNSLLRDKALNNNFNLLILHIFDLESYKKLGSHSDSYIAEKVDLSIDEIERKVRQLEYLEIIKVDENGLYKPAKESERHIVYSKESSNSIHNYWRKLLYEQSLMKGSFNDQIENSLRGAHIIYSSNKKLDMKVAEIVTRMFNDITSAIHNFDCDKKKLKFTHLQVLSINVFNPLTRFFKDKTD
jgi:transcriptional regulator with XRE-family HTH domain